MGKWHLTPSLRVAKFSHLNKHGEQVLIESDGKTMLCRHGERSSSIRTWLLAEARARAEGRPLPKRNSACDCVRTVGLQLAVDRVDAHPVAPPSSVYDLLAAGDCEATVTESGLKAYRLGATYDAYLASNGGIHCKHGALLRTRTRAARPCVWAAPKRGLCKCRVTLPRRMPHLVTHKAQEPRGDRIDIDA